MDIGAEIRSEENFVKNIFGRIRSRNFGGEGGQAIKNSSYQLGQSLIMKIGSLLFTLVIARLLQPERMGLYSLALSTILLFSIFSDLGISAALITYLSKMLGAKKFEKAKGYAEKLFRWKSKLLIISSSLILAGAYFISEYYYQKPIFYAVLVGALYMPIIQLLGFVETFFKAENNFKMPMVKEIIVQIARLVIVPLSIILLLGADLSNKVLIMAVIFAISVPQFIGLVFLWRKRRGRISFLKYGAAELTGKELVDLKKFILPLSATAFAGTFFGYIDTLMLGRYVASEFLAYYGAAFALIGSAGAIIGFMSGAMVPIFSRKNGGELKGLFRKTLGLTLMISFLAGVFTYFAAWWIIRLAYGSGYLAAVPILKWFSVLLVLNTAIGLYSSYFVSQKKTRAVSALLIGATVLNILFNVVGIHLGLRMGGEMGGVYGAVGATILSRVIYLGGFLVWERKRIALSI